MCRVFFSRYDSKTEHDSFYECEQHDWKWICSDVFRWAVTHPCRVKSQFSGETACPPWTMLHQSGLRSCNYKHISSSCMNLTWTGSGGGFFFFFSVWDIRQKIVEHLVFNLGRAQQKDKKDKEKARWKGVKEWLSKWEETKDWGKHMGLQCACTKRAFSVDTCWW